MLENRREFFKTAAAGALGTAGMFGGAAAVEAKAAPKAKYDLIIVGAGCGGLVCAVRAAELGLKPLLLEKMPMPAGNTIYAAGFLLGLNTSFQKAKGVANDTAEAFYNDMMKVSQQQAVPALTKKVVDNCTRLLEWMHSYCGVNFATGAHLVWPMLTRAHLVTGEVKPGGAQLAMTLLNKAKSLGVEVRTSTKVVALLSDPKKGNVTGVRIKTKAGLSEVTSKYGVVLATGGYSANQQLVTQYIGSAGAKMPIRGSRIIAGENIVLTAPFMPKVVHVDQYHCGPIYGPTGANPLNIVNNGICVNKQGVRFTDEGQTYVQMARDVAAKTPDNWAFMICDQTTHDIPILKNDWESYRRTNAPVYTGDTLEAAAKAAGLDPKAVEKTVSDWNEAVKAGKAVQMTPPNTLPKTPVIEKAPFYIVPFQGGMTATFGGPLINTEAQVLDTENRPIEGLFCIGNAAGGLFYDNYVGGAQLTSAGVFGMTVAEHVKAQKEGKL
ncbi:FAD-dependent oxidoreductase [uncultured Sutterella sp.]|uniref:FAD-dependent oxidoreductase n=1 Tax=uncultured Sutterella sp. TaxID=286133 RepID=UPI0025D90427|nr:FAD-dependent oxidoreductase [uncultured Sutterella sp.]